MFPVILTCVVIIGLLLWCLVYPLEESRGAFAFGVLFNFVIIVLRLSAATIIWLISMLIWALWFRG